MASRITKKRRTKFENIYNRESYERALAKLKDGIQIYLNGEPDFFDVFMTRGMYVEPEGGYENVIISDVSICDDQHEVDGYYPEYHFVVAYPDCQQERRFVDIREEVRFFITCDPDEQQNNYVVTFHPDTLKLSIEFYD